MKNILLILLCFLVVRPSFAQSEFSSEQLKLRNGVNYFLKEEGFVPEIDSDGDIKFKSEGNTYYIIVSRNDSSPMYISLYTSFLYEDEFTKSKVSSLIPKLNFFKAVKTICFDDSFSLRAEMYVVDVESFKYVFYKLLKQIKSMKKELVDSI